MKKLFGILGLGCVLSFSVLFIQPKALQVRAEEETQVVEVQEQSITEEITQTCKDCITFMKELLSQPLVIGGVSTTIGALAILIITKAIGGVNKKKLEGLFKELADLKSRVEDSVSKKDFNSLVSEKDELIAILEKIAPTIKNIKLKNECMALLEELKPVHDQVKEFAIEEKDKVVEDAKEEVKVVSNEIADILKQ